MDKLPLSPIDLVAIDPTRNIRRRWSLIAVPDLFGQVIVETHWCRLGHRGQRLARSFPDEQTAVRYTCTLLARRRTAERRLSVGYVGRGTESR